ncbi:hypothetical protein BHE74_00033873 [Ensete ventricosum]|nr:hypothetical protein BHE74_00033873 [Ensete ventricosum]
MCHIFSRNLAMHNPHTWSVLYPGISEVAGKVHKILGQSNNKPNLYIEICFPFFPFMQAKMGMMEDFEASLQVLRGFDADITVEVNEVKVWTSTSPIFCTIYVPLGFCHCLLSWVGSNSMDHYVRGTPPATGRFCQKSAVGGRLSEKPTVGAVLARLPSPPAGRPARRSPARRRSTGVVTATAFSPARGDAPSPRKRRRIEATIHLLETHIFDVVLQILPINIKSLAGSVATLANWLTSFGITMTANLLLNWSSGG